MLTLVPRFRSSFACAVALLAAACSPRPQPVARNAADVAPPAASAPGPRPALGSFGVDLSGVDRTVAPGDDFFAFANGNWVTRTQIPADRASFNSFAQLTELALAQTRALIEGAASTPEAGGDERKVGDFYRAYMDEAAIEKRGLSPLTPELDAIARITDKRQLAATLGATVRADVDLLNATDYYTDRPFGLWISQRMDDPGRYIPYLVQGGLGMPDRDFYLKEGRFAALRAQYRAHIEQVLRLAGDRDASAQAERILGLETAIARVHATQVETDDVQRGKNLWSRADFAARAPGLQWDALLEAAGLGAQQDFVVWQPEAVRGVAKLVGSQPLSTWKAYLRFHAIDRMAPLLPRAFADLDFAFYQQALSGVEQQPERWKRGVQQVDNSLGEAVGKLYIARHFSKETKAHADQMVQNLLRAFGERIDRLDWMAQETKQQARAKLAGMRIGMGYPERFIDYSALEVRPDDAFGNRVRASLFEYRRNLDKLGKPVDHAEWFLLPHEVNALNVPLENRLIFPAAILQPPFFDPAADDAVNYGAIGAVIGHEISHSFDSSGAQFDPAGRLSNWWTPDDLTRFKASGAALIAQYDAYRPFPDTAVNGRLTLGENIADVAGLATAYDAYRMARGGQADRQIDGFGPDQRFFLGWAQVWRTKAREPALRNSLLTNVHAPGQYRAQTVRNLEAWYAAFGVQPGQRSYLAPAQRVLVW